MHHIRLWNQTSWLKRYQLFINLNYCKALLNIPYSFSAIKNHYYYYYYTVKLIYTVQHTSSNNLCARLVTIMFLEQASCGCQALSLIKI